MEKFKATYIDENDQEKRMYSFPEHISTNNILVHAVGIDLGTSRCCAAVNRKNGIVTVQLDNTGERLLPSYVAYDEENVKCGRVVVNRLRQFSKSTVFDSKRIIGRNFNDIEIDSNWPFGISLENGNVILGVKKHNDGIQLTAEIVASDLLKYMKLKTEEFQGSKLSDVVITVPAAFTKLQKEATLKAAKIA
uniref:Heat shock protein 70 n=1 Tax=Panagrolaimus sp. ES5 TaxID=591445 RepID=A0AC34FIM0_9BILA